MVIYIIKLLKFSGSQPAELGWNSTPPPSRSLMVLFRGRNVDVSIYVHGICNPWT